MNIMEYIGSDRICNAKYKTHVLKFNHQTSTHAVYIVVSEE